MLQDALLIPLRAILEDDPLIIETSWAGEQAPPFAQPSTANPSPSPAECIEIIIPFGDGVVLDIVRDSFALPEYTANGLSRWRNAAATAALPDAFLDHHNLPPGQAALIGPGTILRPRRTKAAAALRILCLPTRCMPASMAFANENTEYNVAEAMRPPHDSLEAI